MRLRYIVAAIVLVLSIAVPAAYKHNQQKKQAALAEAVKQLEADRKRPPGEHLLELARMSPKLQTVEDARRRADNLLARLGVPQPVRDQYAKLALREVRKVEGAVSEDSISGIVLVAGGPVRLRAATQSIVISPAPVDVRTLSGSLVVSGATVRIGDDAGEPGASVIAAKGTITVASTARGTQLYSLAGAVLPRWGFTDGVVAYSTGINAEFPGQVKEAAASVIFAQEPARAASAPAQEAPAAPSAGEPPSTPAAEPLAGNGERCDRTLSPNHPEPALVAAAKRQANCESVDRMEVHCVSAERAPDGYLMTVEEWEFQMCAQKILATIDRRAKDRVETDVREAGAPAEK